jgi:adenosylcobinamide-GDP ribazoletransferase
MGVDPGPAVGVVRLVTSGKWETGEGLMRAAIAFLTPFGRPAVPCRRATGWFPFVGVVIGLAVGLVWWGAAKVFPAAVAAAVAVAADAAMTGLLHLDGLADSADGLLPPMSREQRLEVMRDPAVGAFGVLTVVLVLVLRVAALSALSPGVLVVAALWGSGRAGMVVLMRLLPYVRADGLASAFLGGGTEGEVRPGRDRRDGEGPTLVLGTGVGLCVALAVIGGGLHGLAAVGGVVAGSAAVALLARARIGGFTGDVLGAAGVIGETVGLLVLVAR